MLFNSFEYFVFLPVVVLACFMVPARFRVWLLLLASYVFYMFWRWEYVALIIAQTEINYYCGLRIAKSEDAKKRGIWLAVALVLTLAILFFFKYFNFANNTLRWIFQSFQATYSIPNLNVLLPVGISFHTFQALSYTIDLYRGKIPVERSFPRFALFVTFFPLLVAGPIERAHRLLPRFAETKHFDVERTVSGLKMILWGLFKKVVIADSLAVYVAQIYGRPEQFPGATLALATYFFAFQIYCDFSGYTDIAIGSARILGCDMMQNFNLPYLARSISEFWQRWHISLSTWFRDYVYIPLGGNRGTSGRWAFNILVTFLVSGLWHGANWTFIIWGGLHGFYYLIERGLGPAARRFAEFIRLPGRLVAALQILVTFHLVLIAWVFFRAKSISDAMLILSRIATDLTGKLYLGPSVVSTTIGIAFICLLCMVMILQFRGKIPLYFSGGQVPVAVRWCAYLALLLGIAMFGKSGNDFIYFQF
jgi:alginate O-acetyltransferase complex protein AlgI